MIIVSLLTWRTPQIFDPTPDGNAADVTLALTGVAATGAPGLLGVSMIEGLSGVAAAGAVGTLIPGIETSVALTGVAAPGAAGTLAPAMTLALTGVSAAGASGVLSVGGDVTLELAGVAATGQIGTLINLDALLSQVAGGDGSRRKAKKPVAQPLSADVTLALTGVSAHGRIGQLRVKSNVIELRRRLQAQNAVALLLMAA